MSFDASAAALWVKGKGKHGKGPGPPPPPKAAAQAAKAASKGANGSGSEAPSDPLALLRAHYGDKLAGKEDLVAQLEALLAAPAPEPPVQQRAPLLEEEVSTKGIAARRAAKALELAAL